MSIKCASWPLTMEATLGRSTVFCTWRTPRGKRVRERWGCGRQGYCGCITILPISLLFIQTARLPRLVYQNNSATSLWLLCLHMPILLNTFLNNLEWRPRLWPHWLKSCVDTCFSLGKCSPLDPLERKKDLGTSDGPQIVWCQLASKK